MPTPIEESSSPPPDPSPKRKRVHSITGDSLQINTRLKLDELNVSGSNSPRTKVADKFSRLEIYQQPPPSSLGIDGARKRLKLDAEESQGGDVGTPQRDARTGSESLNEVEETPNCHSTVHVSSPTSEDQVTVTITKEDVSTYPHFSSSPPIAFKTLAPGTEQSIERALSPLPSAEDLSSDQAALTWQDDEITGHELDLSGGDDGEGINGIGFRPTPAIAYARQQRRKQQVNEWKAREARDARQRRFERRRGHMGGDGNGHKGRVVRFKDMG
jgi:hypothetical protein